MGFEALRKNGMMAHLLDSLEEGKNIGHYGRLVFAMVARHFVDDDALVAKLRQDKVLQFQAQQEFPICPNPEDPDACNVYKDLQFPESVYSHISEYREQKAHAHAVEEAAEGQPG